MVAKFHLEFQWAVTPRSLVGVFFVLLATGLYGTENSESQVIVQVAQEVLEAVCYSVKCWHTTCWPWVTLRISSYCASGPGSTWGRMLVLSVGTQRVDLESLTAGHRLIFCVACNSCSARCSSCKFALPGGGGAFEHLNFFRFWILSVGCSLAKRCRYTCVCFSRDRIDRCMDPTFMP
jgi:hypothetical protein